MSRRYDYDEDYYRRADARDRAKYKRQQRFDADIARRTAIIAQAKAGDMSWAEAMRMIRRGAKPKERET